MLLVSHCPDRDVSLLSHRLIKSFDTDTVGSVRVFEKGLYARQQPIVRQMFDIPTKIRNQ